MGENKRRKLKCRESRDHGKDVQLSGKALVELPSDVLDSVIVTFVKQFALKYAIRCSLTSKRWLDIMMREAPSEPPWILLADRSADSSESNRYLSFMSLWGREDSGPQVYKLGCPPISNEYQLSSCGHLSFGSSQGGWMIFGCSCRELPNKVRPGLTHPLSLYNPFSKVYVLLPTFSPSVHLCCPFTGVRPQGFLVFYYKRYACEFVAMIMAGDRNLALCKLGGGDKWSYYHNRRHLSYVSVLFRKEEQHLYTIDLKGGLDIFTVEYENDGGSHRTLRLQLLVSVQVTPSDINEIHFVANKIFLVESLSDILIVTYNMCVKDIVVYKLGKEMCVHKLQSIGDQALFLEYGSASFAVSAKYFPKVLENCVYLPSDCRVQIYSLSAGFILQDTYLGMGVTEMLYETKLKATLMAPPPLALKEM